MKKSICMLALVAALLVGSPSLWAQSSTPTIQGGVQGIELCPQFICGFAAFTGVFQGQIGGNPSALGLISAAMTHDDLPTEIGAWSEIRRGVWELRTLTRRIRGAVTGGRITYIGGNIFQISIAMELRSGGSGVVVFSGFLNHNTPIPTFGGNLLQLP